jgi:hypothetical protein
LVTFIEVISFFGVSSFFAWLAFVALQNEQLERYKNAPEDLKKARTRLFTIYDFFLISFTCFVISFVADYLVHMENMAVVIYFDTYHAWQVYGIVGAFFILGLLTLALPISYIRSISSGKSDPVTVDPPSFITTFSCFLLAVMNLVTALAEYGMIGYWDDSFWWGVWRISWVLILVVSAAGFLLLLHGWNAAIESKIRNGSLLFLPIILAVVVTVLHLPW